MASMAPRGQLFVVTYTVKGIDGKRKSCHESYPTEIEAAQRKAYIDILQKAGKADELRILAESYKDKKGQGVTEDNMGKTYRDFVEKWLPYYAKKKKLSPVTYDGHKRILERHILPYLGDRIVSTIKSEDLDLFVEHLEQTKCRGSKSYNKSAEEVPNLKASTIVKVIHTLNASLRTAENWRYTNKRPKTLMPPIEAEARKSWDSEYLKSVLVQIHDPFLHLLVHLVFVCSLRAGEAAGLRIEDVNLDEGSIRVNQELERITEEALAKISEKDIYHVFPQKSKNTNSVLVLKKLKTKGSKRKCFLPAPLVDEIRARIISVQRFKDFYCAGYGNSGLLFCLENGDPQEPRLLTRKFTKWQRENKISNPIDLQGLRKSGQTHKVHITGNDYQVVAEMGGQSTKVLFDNYLAVDDGELKNLRDLIEDDFYAQTDPERKQKLYVQSILKKCDEDPTFLKLLLNGLQSAYKSPSKH